LETLYHEQGKQTLITSFGIATIRATSLPETVGQYPPWARF